MSASNVTLAGEPSVTKISMPTVCSTAAKKSRFPDTCISVKIDVKFGTVKFVICTKPVGVPSDHQSSRATPFVLAT